MLFEVQCYGDTLLSQVRDAFHLFITFTRAINEVFHIEILCTFCPPNLSILYELQISKVVSYMKDLMKYTGKTGASPQGKLHDSPT